MVIGLDTSVLIRLLIGLPSEQASTAVDLIKKARIAGRQIVVSDLVVSEVYFALNAHYDVPKRAAIGALLEILRSRLVEPADGPAVIEMLEEAARSSSKPGTSWAFLGCSCARQIPTSSFGWSRPRSRRR